MRLFPGAASNRPNGRKLIEPGKGADRASLTHFHDLRSSRLDRRWEAFGASWQERCWLEADWRWCSALARRHLFVARVCLTSNHALTGLTCSVIVSVKHSRRTARTPRVQAHPRVNWKKSSPANRHH